MKNNEDSRGQFEDVSAPGIPDIEIIDLESDEIQAKNPSTDKTSGISYEALDGVDLDGNDLSNESDDAFMSQTTHRRKYFVKLETR